MACNFKIYLWGNILEIGFVLVRVFEGPVEFLVWFGIEISRGPLTHNIIKNVLGQMGLDKVPTLIIKPILLCGCFNVFLSSLVQVNSISSLGSGVIAHI